MLTKPREAPKVPKTDLPWRKDAKWINGILGVLLLLISLPLFTLASLTDHDTSVDLSSNVFGMVLSPEGMDDPARVDALRTLLAKQNGAIKPIPGVDIRVAATDIANMTPRQVRLFMFRQLSEPLWQSGDAGLSRAVENPQILAALRAQGLGILPLMNRNIHDQLDGWARLFLFLGLVFVILTVAASRGFGYLVSPGIALTIASLPGYLFVNGIVTTITNLAESGVPADNNPSMSLAYTAASALLPHAQKLMNGYDVLLVLGIGCLVAAFLGNGFVYLYQEIKPWITRSQAPK